MKNQFEILHFPVNLTDIMNELKAYHPEAYRDVMRLLLKKMEDSFESEAKRKAS